MSGPLGIADLVERAKHDELLARIDALCEDRDWDGLVDLRDRCQKAVDRGKQLWGVAHHADYRLALEAPAGWAGPVVTSPAGRFTLGPLTEVAASTHTWGQLEPFLASGPSRAIVAHERIVRGEDLSDADFDRQVLELPAVLAPWEPEYVTPTYRAHRVECDAPAEGSLTQVRLDDPGLPVDDPEATDALLALVKTWTEQSNGTSEVAVVEGDARGAIRSLGLRAVRMASLSPSQALRLMAWAAADGGAHGRRSGAAAGRFAAWWAAAALTDLVDEWPPPADRLGSEIATLRWYRWADLYPTTGWECRLAVEDPVANYAWVLNAADAD